ncbi:anion permease [Megalodesulfovibrio gigas]|uniref:Putative anion transporter n=1 Tax=Megalodesulfovibrio gigas (strain ATCC 19364 / DSM 1382 / NCIMB 9332 / VKM B-1759) TaxID=1121448 RepID=T2G9S2_MEGG1|nr:anion permease [Megalodesulfovibrio gigas]AGW12876.1 putative anion transporter [Megalodesulfovibrio gigas DSM 1382 = ATCC 19364]
MQRVLKMLAPVLLGLVLWLLPAPAGLTPAAWAYFSLFAAVVLALVLEPIPPALAGLVGVTVAAVFRLVPLAPDKAPSPGEALKWALSGFSDGTVWLIFGAFMFALGYEKTGLGKRLGLTLIKRMGKKTLGLGYAVALADLILAPFMPSNTARSGGTIFPIIKNIPPLYGSTPENNPRGLGAYLMWTALATTCVTSSLFLTGLAPNVLAQSLVEKTAKITLNWNYWFMSVLPVGVILFLATPLLTYIIYPPTQKTSENAPIWAAEELEKLGPISGREISMALLAVGALLGWIFLKDYVNGTTVALVVICVMVTAKVVSWEDVLGYKQAWNVLAWFATLVTLADGLSKTGFLKWFAGTASAYMQGFSPTATLLGLVVLFFVSHYMFASVTAHVAALLPVMLAAAMAVPGLDMTVASMALCATLGIMGIITPYGTGPSPIYFGSGYIKSKEFWYLGFIFGTIFLAVFLLVGFPWILMRG